MASPSKSLRTRAATLEGVRVLVIDDHPYTLGLIKDVLYASGAASETSARNGLEAIAMFNAFGPHLVVTDWRMPEMDGLAFIRTVREAALHPDPRIHDPQVPIVMMSAHASTKAVETARRAGVNEVVVKPFSITVLIERLLAATSPRPFVVTEAYIGPDRRRRYNPASAVGGRRASDRDLEHAAAPAALRLPSPSALRRLQRRLDAVETEVRKPQRSIAS